MKNDTEMPDPFVSESQTEIGADAPFAVVHGKALFVADVSEIVHHRQTEELIAPMTNNGTASSDDDLWEMIVKGYMRIAENHRRVTIDNERG